MLIRSALFLGMTAGLVPVYLLVLPFGKRARNGIARLWFRGCCNLCALRLRIIGAPHEAGSTFYAVNHVSYLDIVALGAVLDAVFVAKREVRGWPLFGPLARLVRTEFISRKANEAEVQTRSLAARLAEGESLIVFPEGTSTDGFGVRPFKTSLFGVTAHLPEGSDLKVQPVSISYPRYVTGKALIGGLEALYAWYGEMTLLPHLLGVFGLRGAEVEIRFHEPVAPAAMADRKELARYCEDRVAEGIALANGFSRQRAYRQAA